MTNDDLKQIRKAVKDVVKVEFVGFRKVIREDVNDIVEFKLEPIRNKLDDIEDKTDGILKYLDNVTDDYEERIKAIEHTPTVAHELRKK